MSKVSEIKSGGINELIHSQKAIIFMSQIQTSEVSDCSQAM